MLKLTRPPRAEEEYITIVDNRKLEFIYQDDGQLEGIAFAPHEPRKGLITEGNSRFDDRPPSNNAEALLFYESEFSQELPCCDLGIAPIDE